MATITTRTAKPVTGVCRWVLGNETARRQIDLDLPAALFIARDGGERTMYYVTRIYDQNDHLPCGWRLEKEDGSDVHLIAGDFGSCTCRDSVYRNRECKHIKALRAALGRLGVEC